MIAVVKRLFRRFMYVLFGLIILLGVVCILIINSERLSSHKASLQCYWTDGNDAAKARWAARIGTVKLWQLRYDWVHRRYLLLTPKKNLEQGVEVFKPVYQKVDRYTVNVSYSQTESIDLFIDRETLQVTMEVSEDDETTSNPFDKIVTYNFFSKCENVDPSVFHNAVEKNIAAVKKKQKI